MTNPLNSIPPGKVVGGKYRIGEMLGAGGNGCVYKAVDVDIGLKVAIKHLHAALSRNEEAFTRFQREAKRAASIGHDNICEVIELGTAENGTPFLVMPQLRGRSLGDLIEKHGTVPPAVIIDIVCQTLSALEAAHREHIVHRDLKPDNIFITTLDDRGNFVKLLDFGISEIMAQDTVSGNTAPDTIAAPPDYMAPEQIGDRQEIDGRTDIWSIGVILFEALTGERPFSGKTYSDILFSICEDPIPAPSELNPAVPPLLEEVILQAMSRDPKARFQSAAEMRDALENIRERISTTPPPLPHISTAAAFANTKISTSSNMPNKMRRYLQLMTAVLILSILFIVAVLWTRKHPSAAPPLPAVRSDSSTVESTNDTAAEIIGEDRLHPIKQP